MYSLTPAGLVQSLRAPLSVIECELLVVPWFEGEEPSSVPGLDAASGGEVARALASREFSGKPFECFGATIGDRGWRARRLLLVGAGPAADCGAEMLRKVAAAAGLSVRARRVERAAFALRGSGDDIERAQAAAEGLVLAQFNVGGYKTGDVPAPLLPAWTVVAGDGTDESRLRSAVERGRLLGECSNLAKGLANEPGNTLTPREFAARASAIAADGGAAVEVLDEHQIERLGMGLLLGVGRGSSEPPRLMVFRHEPPGAPAGPVLGLVGKGITFDTGGISIKHADGMERMKSDMSGGAAVAAAMRAIARLGAPIRVVGIVPAAENMPGGRAIRPGDILTSASGKT
ncbi:MAG: M17 family peptidase N-terminal domain-containing protein, partial [Acidobacteriota bacterium]